MRLSIKKFALSCSILWGLAILIVSTANMIWPNYGNVFLSVFASIYPGYAAMQGIGSVIVGTLYALVDAAIAGAIFAWLYNFLPD
jgi:ABC-type phosphate transport system permease subunit